MRSKVKSLRLIVYAKIACDRVISRTDGWIPARLRSCMYLEELMNCLIDLGVTRSKVTGLIIVCDHIIIRTDGWITMELERCMYLAQPIN